MFTGLRCPYTATDEYRPASYKLGLMTKLLEKAFGEAVKLPKKEQDKLASSSNETDLFGTGRKGHRAVGVREGEEIVWFWIGSRRKTGS